MSVTIIAPPSKSRGSIAVPPTREQALAAVLDPNRLPSPPAVALQIVNSASRPDCTPGEIIALLGMDPALCGKVLRAVNSCLYGLKQPVASVARAVQVLGLKTVRSLALGLSLPAVKVGQEAAKEMRDFWISSVSGAIIARELSARNKRPNPDDDLVAGLLRDLGEMLLRATYPDAWADHLDRHGDRIVSDPCGAERESFGIDHAEVSAELLASWGLPADVVEPVRHHHRPERLAAESRVLRERAEVLWLASSLAQLDSTAQVPSVLFRVLGEAETRFGLSRQALVDFLQRLVPKIEGFSSVLNQDVGQCPDFAAVLAAGAAELVNLTVQQNRDKISGTIVTNATVRARPNETTCASQSYFERVEETKPAQPEFRSEFAANVPEGGFKLGDYEVKQLLGRGAMGVVFKAFEPKLEREVAIKILAPDLSTSENARKRFAREARAAAAIHHENVVAVYAVGETAGVPYLAMEFVRGASLESHVGRSGQLPLPQFISIARQLAAGLGAAHARHIVHRDVKPANILIEDETNRVKLTDFGLARAGDDATLTADGTLIGTPFFMAPEVISGSPATTASDVFSLGGVYYLMATGRLPFEGETVMSVLNAVATRAPMPIRQLRPDLPTWVEELIMRLMTKDPAARLRDATAVAAALAAR